MEHGPIVTRKIVVFGDFPRARDAGDREWDQCRPFPRESLFCLCTVSIVIIAVALLNSPMPS